MVDGAGLLSGDPPPPRVQPVSTNSAKSAKSAKSVNAPIRALGGRVIYRTVRAGSSGTRINVPAKGKPPSCACVRGVGGVGSTEGAGPDPVGTLAHPGAGPGRTGGCA